MTEPQTNEWQVQETLSMEELSKKIQDATEELNQLKQGLNNLSLEEQNSRLAEIEASIFDCSESLEELENDNATTINQEQLNALKSQVDILKSEKESLKQQIETKVKTEMEALNKSVTSQTAPNKQNDENWWESEQQPEWWEPENNEGWNRFWRQREWLTSKQEWKDHTWKNVLRTLWWVWIIWWTAWLVKKLFTPKDYESEIPWYSQMSRKEKRLARKELRRQKREERREEKWEFRDRPFGKFLKWTGIGTVAYVVAHGIYTKNWHPRDIFDWERGKKLSFKDALAVAEWNIANQKDDKSMSYDIDLKYLEESSEIEAYGQKVKINVKKRTIEWLWDPAIRFKKYEHMISTAILIAYLKKSLSWKCNTNAPFNRSGTRRWNLNADGNRVVDWTWISWMVTWVSVAWVLAIVSWIYGWLPTWAVIWTTWWILWACIWHAIDADNILNNYMPELDSEYWLKSLAAYLNRQDCRQRRNQTIDDISESPLKEEVREIVDEIQSTNPDLPNRGWRRSFDMIQDPNDPDKYTIKAYWMEILAEVKERDLSYLKWSPFEEFLKYVDKHEMKILWISWWNPKIKADTTKGKISELKLPLKEWLYMSALLWFFVDNFKHKWTEYPYFWYGDRTGLENWWIDRWIYFSDKRLDTWALTEEKFKDRMPTLFEESNRNNFLKFLNDGITDDSNISIWKEK